MRKYSHWYLISASAVLTLSLINVAEAQTATWDANGTYLATTRNPEFEGGFGHGRSVPALDEQVPDTVTPAAAGEPQNDAPGLTEQPAYDQQNNPPAETGDQTAPGG